MQRHPVLPPLYVRFGTPECRQRRVEPHFHVLPTGGAAVVPSRSPERVSWTSFVPGAFFVLAVIVYLTTGFVRISFMPQATSRFADRDIPDSAICARVTRHTDYVTANLAVGTPVSMHEVLLRLDRVLARDAAALRLFSKRVAESESVSCQGAQCTDVTLVHPEGPSSEPARVVTPFEYTNPATESLSYSTASTLGLDGELSLKRGFEYHLTATHLCWSATNATSAMHGGAALHIAGECLYAKASALQSDATLRDTPASVAESDGHCFGLGDVAMFPGAAGDEAAWLGLASQRAYEISPTGVDDRRAVVEIGSACRQNHTQYERANSLYRLDCMSVYVSCDDAPSVPYRRLATSQLHLRILDDGSDSAQLLTEHDCRLASLPKLSDNANAMGLSLLKLSLMTLAAAVTWIRAAKSTASLDRLFMYCVRMAHCPTYNQNTLTNSAVLEDAFIGLIAIAARIGVGVWRLRTLYSDGQIVAPVSQLVAGTLSLVQWYVRYRVLDRKCETPLTKLGGSTALVDATCAVMLGFSEPPLMVSSMGRFDPTARLLTALLVSTMTVQRCLFATACCALLYAVASEDASKPVAVAVTVAPALRGRGAAAQETGRFHSGYVPWIFAGAVAWLLQTASVAIIMADLFAVPLAHSMTRSLPSGWAEMGAAIFTASTAAGLPTLMLTLKSIAQDAVLSPRDPLPTATG